MTYTFSFDVVRSCSVLAAVHVHLCLMCQLNWSNVGGCRWGVAGQSCVVYVEDFEGRVGVMTQIEDIEAVAAALDRRGVRELALSAAIDKSYK